MPRHHRRQLLALGGIAAMIAATVAAAPVADSATVTVDGSTISVAGTLGADLDDVVIGLDDLGDSLMFGAGADLVEMRVGFPEAGKVALSLVIGDANPGTGHTPAAAQFAMTPTIGAESIELIAGADMTSGGLKYASQTCEASTGTNQCTSTPVEGSYADGAITWTLPTTAAAGAMINGGTGSVYAQFGNPSLATLTLTGTAMDDMGVNALAYIPSANLLIDGVSVASGRLTNAGYSVATAGVSAGTHNVSVELCGGAGDCTIVDLGDVEVS